MQEQSSIEEFNEKEFNEKFESSREEAREALKNAKNFYCVSFDENGKATLNLAVKAKPELCVGMLIAIVQDLENRLVNLCEFSNVQENTKTD